MLKKLSILAILVCVVGAGAASAGPPNPKATGGATWMHAGCMQHIAFNVKYDAKAVDENDPYEPNATGQLEFIGNPEGEECRDRPLFHAELTCLYVQGNEAWIGGWITGPHPDWFPFNGYFVLYVQDNGQGNAEDPDRVTWPEFGIYRPCNHSYFEHLAGISLPVTEGNIQVH